MRPPGPVGEAQLDPGVQQAAGRHHPVGVLHQDHAHRLPPPPPRRHSTSRVSLRDTWREARRRRRAAGPGHPPGAARPYDGQPGGLSCQRPSPEAHPRVLPAPRPLARPRNRRRQGRTTPARTGQKGRKERERPGQLPPKGNPGDRAPAETFPERKPGTTGAASKAGPDREIAGRNGKIA